MTDVLAAAGLAAGLLWFAIYGVLVNVACIVNGRWLARAASRELDTTMVAPRRFLFVVPTVGEESLFQTLHALDGLETRQGVNLEIVVVGGLAGIGSSDRPATALDAFRAYREPRFALHALGDPGSGSGKPERLNFALRWARESGREFDYVVMVDSDTEVPANLVRLMMEAASGETPADWPTMLQPLLASVPSVGAGVCERAEAVMHTRWRLGYELTLLRIAHRAGSPVRRRWAPLSYGVGCCLAVRVGGARFRFPSPAEDLALGYATTGQGRAIVPVRAVAITSTKPTAAEIAERHRAWFTYSRDALRREARAARAIRHRLLVDLERARLLAWIPGPAAFAVLLALQLLAVSFDEAAVRVGMIVALALAVYATAAAAVALGGQGGRYATGFKAMAACLVRWTWSAALPSFKIARDRVATARPSPSVLDRAADSLGLPRRRRTAKARS